VTTQPISAENCLPERFIHLEGCPNFRDLGGYAAMDGRSIRWRQLYRSMTPEYLSERDVEIANRLGIRLIVDLRGQQAATSGPLSRAPARRLRVGHARMLADTRADLVKYANLRPEEALPVVLLRLGRAYAKAASAIANEDGASLVHCRLGKDRTGVFAAVILKTLGVSDEDVVQDYMLSNINLESCHQILALREARRRGAVHSRIARESANRPAIRKVLRILDAHYGGGADYLHFHGMRMRDLETLQARLLE
jgi:protein-tyrosine phosphatase